MKRFTVLIILFNVFFSFSQVKIGDNPSQIHSNSILELESSDKVLVISRMSTAQINAIKPLQGALVYNTDTNCVYMYDGSSWRSLCNAMAGINVITSNNAPTNPNLGDFWINPSQNNGTNIWDGTDWIALDQNPIKGNGSPTASTVPNPNAGDVYVDTTTGKIFAYDGTTWVQNGANINANNGLLVSANNTVQLGGTLIQPTVIKTDATNTFAIEGLPVGDLTQDEIVTVNTDGELRKVSASNLLREEVTTLTANDDQLTFESGFTLKSTDKINVYRNGVRISFTIDSNTKITLEPEAKCYAGDEIRIVQFY